MLKETPRNFSYKSHYDVFNLKFSEIGGYIESLIEKLNFYTTYNLKNNYIDMFITFRITQYKNFPIPFNDEIKFVHIDVEKPESFFFEHYQAEEVYEFFIAMNKINQKYKIINKHFMNLYDLGDFLEEIILTKS